MDYITDMELDYGSWTRLWKRDCLIDLGLEQGLNYGNLPGI
jgi:hypothetical protein